MIEIKDREYGGERPLYRGRGLSLERTTIHIGESALKETADIVAHDCQFEGKYVLWECKGACVEDSRFLETSRASIWYSNDIKMRNCTIVAPKMFRRTIGIQVSDCTFTNAEETLWDCRRVRIERCRMEKGDYLAMHTIDMIINNLHLDGNYSFQYGKNIVISNSLLNSKDALWESKDVTVIDSTINGEYLGWYSKNLRLVRCHITGTQPLCYCENLVMEHCTMGEDADLAFEYSTVRATINGNVHSIKNPTGGNIAVSGQIGDVILDENQKQPANCIITQQP